MEATVENYKKQRLITDEIDLCISKIWNDTRISSNPHDILDHESFKRLVNMGDKIVNYLFYQIFEHGSSDIHILLLHELVGGPDIPKEHAGHFYHITVYWMKWYLESDFIKNNDIYFGLVKD